MRRERTVTAPGAARRTAHLAAVVVCLIAPAAAEAGLRLQRAWEGEADVRAAAQTGGVVWTSTPGGVYRAPDLWSGATFDGLAGRTVTSLAAAGNEVWAATGEELWRRSDAGGWQQVPLPAAADSPPFPTVLATDATGTLWVGGLGAQPTAPNQPTPAGVWKRTGEAFTAVPSPGFGIVTAMLADPQGLLVGLSGGSAARWNGSGWTALEGGVGPSEPIRALASFGGTLWAGTSVALYAWNGSAWVADTAFGRHDVRALTAAGGVLRAATVDAAVLARSGAAWVADSSGILPRGAQLFLEVGSELCVGTAGGGLYRRVGAGWTGVGGSGGGGWVRDAAPDVNAGFFASAYVAFAGSGLTLGHLWDGPAPTYEDRVLARVPDGCGEATALARTASSFPEAWAATSCGPYLLTSSTATPVGSGLPAGVVPTTLVSHGSTLFGGTVGSGLWRLDGASWTTDPVADHVGRDGVGTGSVRALRSIGGALWVAMAEGLYARSAGSWTDVSAGLPSAGLVASLGGDATVAFAGLATGGIWRRPSGGAFRKDSIGLGSASVSSLDFAGGRLFAAAGSRGVALKRDGGWSPESSGLPAGAEATLVRDLGPLGLASVGSRALFVGTKAHGGWWAEAEPAMRTLPVVLDVVGATGSRFLSELVLGSKASADRDVFVRYTPAPGFAGPGGRTDSSTVKVALAGGREVRAADALAWLRALGMQIPVATREAPVAGSVSVYSQFGGVLDDVYLIARTYTSSPTGGTFGLFYGGPSDLDAAEEEAAVYGLRSVAGEARSNLAVVHLPGRGTDPIEVSVQVYSAAGVATGDPLVRTLVPGQWTQWNGVLGLAGLPDGSHGYARIRRTSGVGAFAAYGVVNDAKTSDGSYLPAFRPGGLAAARTVIVPVVLDVWGEARSHYTTEVTLVNDGPIGTPVDLFYRPAPGFGEVGGVPFVSVELAPRQQVTIPDVLAYLRAHGMQIPEGTVAAQAGTLAVSFRWLTELDAPSTVVLARTTTPNPDAATGGAFGLFYPGVAKGGGARTSALVPGLSQDGTVRSNVAVVNLGGGSELPITLEARLYDADTGAAAGSPLSVTLAPGDWHQWSRIHEKAGAPASVKRFRVVVTRTSGDDTFLAYGVLNDAVTSDGSFQTMISSDPY